MEKVVFNIGGVNIEMDKETASQAIEAGTVIELKSEELITYTKEEHDTYTKNTSDNQYKKGRVDSAEMLIKEIKELSGADFTGKVVKNETDNVDYKETAALFVNGITPILEKKVNQEPSAKLKESLEANDILRSNYKKLEGDFDIFKGEITKKETRTKKDNTILSFIPDNIIVDKDIALLTLKAKTGLDVDDDGMALFNGAVTKDRLQQDIPLSKDIITEKLTALNLIKPIKGGKGGEDEPGGGAAGSYEKFVVEMEKAGTKAGSEDFNIELNKRIKDKTLVM